jgi:hypothetical protein
MASQFGRRFSCAGKRRVSNLKFSNAMFEPANPAILLGFVKGEMAGISNPGDSARQKVTFDDGQPVQTWKNLVDGLRGRRSTAL